MQPIFLAKRPGRGERSHGARISRARTSLSGNSSSCPAKAAGGKHWKSRSDPEWQTLAAWLNGGTTREDEVRVPFQGRFFRIDVSAAFPGRPDFKAVTSAPGSMRAAGRIGRSFWMLIREDDYTQPGTGTDVVVWIDTARTDELEFIQAIQQRAGNPGSLANQNQGLGVCSDVGPECRHPARDRSRPRPRNSSASGNRRRQESRFSFSRPRLPTCPAPTASSRCPRDSWMSASGSIWKPG